MDMKACCVIQRETQLSYQYFKGWNTCDKLIFGVTQSTFKYLVEGFIAAD